MEADLMAIGQHCSHVDCGQKDFLPFQCRLCNKVYCLEHRQCPCSQSAASSVLICPLCAQAVVCKPGEDVELVYDRHTRTDCDPANYNKVHRKPRCPVPACKEKLTSVNCYTCRQCGVTVCLKHRLEADHKCAGKAVAAQSRLSQSWRRMFSVGGTSPAALANAAPQKQPQQQRPPMAAAGSNSRPARPTMGQKAAATAAKAKDSIQSQLQQYRQQRKAGATGTAEVIDVTGSSLASPATATSTGTGPEQCPQCGVRLATVQELIEHAESAHAGGWSSGSIPMQQQQAERCPHCGQTFADAVQLVAHVEQQHAASAATTCVCS